MSKARLVITIARSYGVARSWIGVLVMHLTACRAHDEIAATGRLLDRRLRLAGRHLRGGPELKASHCLPEQVERDLGRPIRLRIDVGFASHILKLAGPAGDHPDRCVGEHGRGVD